MTKPTTPIERAWMRLSLVAQREAQIAELKRQRKKVQRERRLLNVEIQGAMRQQEKWRKVVLGGNENLLQATRGYEGQVISYALKQCDGRLTESAINSRHPELLKKRSKVRKRLKALVSQS